MIRKTVKLMNKTSSCRREAEWSKRGKEKGAYGV